MKSSRLPISHLTPNKIRMNFHKNLYNLQANFLEKNSERKKIRTQKNSRQMTLTADRNRNKEHLNKYENVQF